jgi:hypothetical protein
MSLDGLSNDFQALPFPVLPESPHSTSPTPRLSAKGGIAVFSGGSAANSLVDVFEELRAANRTTLSYVIPISDNGGSSSELIRVFGGPGECCPCTTTRPDTD